MKSPCLGFVRDFSTSCPTPSSSSSCQSQSSFVSRCVCIYSKWSVAKRVIPISKANKSINSYNMHLFETSPSHFMNPINMSNVYRTEFGLPSFSHTHKHSHSLNSYNLYVTTRPRPHSGNIYHLMFILFRVRKDAGFHWYTHWNP